MRYFFAFLAAVALIILVFILIMRGFSGGDRSKIQTLLTDYARTETVMRMQINGPVTADQTHRYLVISVGRNQSTIDIYQGYGKDILKTQSYAGSEEGYRTFLRALQLQGYTKGNADPAKAEFAGECPLGRTYVFEVVTGSSTVQQYWSGSCGGGTFGGSDKVVRQLFRAQIPDFNKLTAGLGLQ